MKTIPKIAHWIPNMRVTRWVLHVKIPTVFPTAVAIYCKKQWGPVVEMFLLCNHPHILCALPKLNLTKNSRDFLNMLN